MRRHKFLAPPQIYNTVLQVCLPLVLSLSATTVMEFTDRIFLANYSINAISAALPAGVTSYIFLAFFGGIGGYVGVFIAQYTGRKDKNNIGRILWQGIYFCILSGVITLLIGLLFSKQIFVLAGHPEEVQKMERLYFSILCYGSIFHIAMSTLSTFFTGRGITRPVMIITLVGVVINIPLDFVLIFGKCGFPELGIAGAALATVTAWVINTVLLAILVFTRKNNQEFQLLTNYKFDKDLFSRLMRYGVPGAMQFTIDILAFTFFILMVGRIGKAELAATNIALSINSLAFMPSMGASQGISVLVGQALGKRKPKHASLYIRSCTHLLLGYIFVVDCLFILFPDVILGLFLHSNSTDSASITVFYYSKTLLNIVCAYLFFDSLYMIYSGALRGAGDTKFMMLAMGSAGICCLIIPTYLSIEYFKMGVTSAWLWIVFFIFILFLLSGLRLRGGKWKKMLVIEDN